MDREPFLSSQDQRRCRCGGKLYARGLCRDCYFIQRGTLCEVCDQLEMFPCPSCGRVA